MQYIVYDRQCGDILFVKKGYSSSCKITQESASGMFPHKKVGVWKLGDRFVDVKSHRVALDANGDPRGMIVFDGEDQHEIVPVKKSPNADKVIYKGVFLDHGGYANMNREIVFRLAQDEDINVKIEIIPSGNQVDKITYQRLQNLSRTKITHKNAVNIIGFTPMQTNLSDFNVFYTMMETQTLHPSFSKLCNQYADHIFTPTQWNKDVFIKGGVKKPIHVIPLGVDENLYFDKPVERLPVYFREFPSGNGANKMKSFNFITLFGWSYRKGIDVLLRAFCSAFTGKDDVGLIICSRYMGNSNQQSKNKVAKDIEGFMSAYSDPPSVYHFGESTKITDMPGLLSNGDCFIWTSRGEGFGLPVCEAGALGMPVISTYNSGMTEFLNEDNSYLIHTDKLTVANRDIDCISPYYVGQYFPELGKSAIASTAEKMKYVYNNYGAAKAKGKQFQKDIKENYTWSHCAELVRETIRKIK